MQIKFLGTGDMFSFEQDHNSAMVEYANTRLIIDFPESNSKVLHKLGIPLSDVRDVFITHLHDDHINGLQQLGYYAQVFGNHKPTLYIHEQLVEPLWCTLEPGMKYTVSGEKSLEDYFDIVPLQEGVLFSIGGISYEMTRTQHVPGMISCGLLARGYFYYSGDSVMDRELLLDTHEDVKLILHECHMQDVTINSHTSLSDIEALPESIQEKILLMHYHDGFANREVREQFNNESIAKLVHPLEVIEL
ncbi:MBL fold metallo-hydrolase [Paenibacillus sp. Marseille-Q4541]|uniref:MBL fold metallo-hydrolase n=1 Tax=Paenibacillus sp. Marseille-Q4541 TaxID=2831522 RepID=UPI001BAA1C57|nr:MBL fold metallo-hydrolase [Paenibacillus sp. Marseille-Q4541]